jgi:hypothetical protein
VHERESYAFSIPLSHSLAPRASIPPPASSGRGRSLEKSARAEISALDAPEKKQTLPKRAREKKRKRWAAQKVDDEEIE